ncbi:MAG: 6-phosphogluconolactonase [Deltaproteobacteria bacterium]|nr:6-phosphogluconolactonase [Deltaproteobacteria bacterium]
MKREIRRFPDLKELSRAASDLMIKRAEECVAERGVFTLVLSGGKTPRTLYEHLARPPVSGMMPWARTHLFWGDERCVPPDHPESNYAMAFKALLSKVPVPPQNIHRIPAEMEPPEDAAAAYEKILRGFFQTLFNQDSHLPSSAEGSLFPSFDLILLGVGEDGHTASLFPGDEVLEERKLWVAAVRAREVLPSTPRITLTLPMINMAECVVFMVSGARKKEAVQSILEYPEKAGRVYPAARVRPRQRVVWFLDNACV